MGYSSERQRGEDLNNVAAKVIKDVFKVISSLNDGVLSQISFESLRLSKARSLSSTEPSQPGNRLQRKLENILQNQELVKENLELYSVQ